MVHQPGGIKNESEANHIQAKYLERLRWILRRAPSDIREDALREVQAHIEDEWQALGGGLEALQAVLQHLGPPEEYGQDLAIQLILLYRDRWRSPANLALAAIFWASTSLIGAIVVVGATLILLFALGMLFTAAERALGIPVILIQARDYQFFNSTVEQIQFPPLSWSPASILLVGLAPAIILFLGLYRFLSLWVSSRLGQRGLWLIKPEIQPVLPPGWERKTLLAMITFAVLGIASCVLFTFLSGLVSIGQPGAVRLPDDFFRTPSTALALIGFLLFLVSPVLGIWWAVKKTTTKAPLGRRLSSRH